jgi:hypothetical protein
MENLDLWAVVLLGIGPPLLLWNRRRIYRRTNQYGVQEFPGFWAKLRSEAFDTALERLAYVSMLAGAFIFIFKDNSAVSWIVLVGLIVALSSWNGQRGNS